MTRNGLSDQVIATMIAIVLALLLPTAALAQQQRETFRNANGQTIGRSVTDTKGNSTFYNALGQQTGRSVTGSNGTVTFFDASGRQTGSATGPKPQKSK